MVRAKLINDDKDRIRFIYYGSHTGTNDSKDFPNVILAGTIFPPVTAHEALGRRASGKASSRRSHTAREISQTSPSVNIDR